MATKTLDITKQGPMSYRQLQQANNLNNFGMDLSSLVGDNDEFGINFKPTLYDPRKDAPEKVHSPLGNWGDSMWDESSANEEQFRQLGDIRANNQWAIAKLGAGISKGLILAGTTFLDGTVGLVYGIGSAIKEGELSNLWNNDFSNAMASINQWSEEMMPNYRTQAEQENPWYKNLGTMNFWADSFLKNMGFTVGAMYSGKVWAAPLQALKLSAVAGEVTGAMVSAVNEGRIEANNNVSDWKKLQEMQVEDAYQKAVAALLPDDPLYNTNLQFLAMNRDHQLQEIEERANAMGNGILLANTVLLSYTNFKTFGKMYSGGFKRAARDFADTEKRELASRVAKEGGKYAWQNYTTKEGVAAGLRTGLREGLEEMNQAWISETFGNAQAPDSPDAYYNALLDADADIQTTDFLTAAAKGFVDTYGNSHKWEEFVVGGLTGIIGVPTFGRMSNASSNTYLGRNKWIGLTGGMFGELSVNNQRNSMGASAVELMNKYADRIQDQKDYFVQSQSFINAMDRWSAENNAFEYKNAEDNDDFAAISAYARVGKLQDLRDLVSKDFENMSNEDLDRIAKYTSKESDDPTVASRGGWRDIDGKYLSETEEGRKQMREDLAKKRDKIIKNIDEYVNSVETVRAAVHESPQVTDDQINELAWLNWKLGRFRDRYAELKGENEALLNTYLRGLNEYKNALEAEIAEQDAYIKEDLAYANDEAFQKSRQVFKSLNQMISFIEGLQKTSEPFGIAALLRDKDFDEFVKGVFSEENFDLFNTLGDGQMQYSEAKKLYDDLQDITKMAVAADQFNKRYRDFIENPLKIVENRQKQEAKAQDTRNDKAARDLASKLEEDFEGTLENVDIDEVEDALRNAPTVTPEIENMLQKLEQKKQFDSTKNRIVQIVNESDASSQVKIDVKNLLDKITNSEDLFAFDSALYNDFRSLYREDDSSLFGKSDAEMEALLIDRLNIVKEYIIMAKDIVDKDFADMEDIGSYDIADAAEASEVPTTGNDETATVEAAQTAGEHIDSSSSALTKDGEFFVSVLDINNTAYVEKVKTLVSTINTALNRGKKEDEILTQILPKEKVYVELKSAYANLDLIIAQYFMDKLDTDPINSYHAGPIDTTDAIKKANDNSLIGESSNKEKKYWSPIQSMLPFHIADNSADRMKKFYELVGTPGYEGYSGAQKKYIQAVGKYLEDKGTWDRIDSGLVHNNEEIHFITDPTLNEQAGAFVILIADKEGNVLGNLPTEADNEGNQLDSTFGTYSGLKEFADYAKSYYIEKGEMPLVVSHLDKWMIGKVIFTPQEEKHTAQQVFTSTNSEGMTVQVPMMLGVAASNKSGQIRIVKDSARRQSTEPDAEILQPISIRNGQPFILYPTGNPASTRKYVAVPVMMRTFDNENSQFNNIIRERVQRIFSLPAMVSATEIGKAKQALQEVLGGKFNIQVSSVLENGDTALRPRITLSIRNAETGKWDKVHTALIIDQNSVNSAVEACMENLVGRVPYQMSLKYVNKQIGNVDYNSIIAPYIEVNTQSGITHTVSNWFTIKPLKKNENGLFVEQKADKPKSVGKNSSISTTGVETFAFKYNGNDCIIDTNTWSTINYPNKNGGVSTASLYDASGNLNINSAKAAAYAYGLFKKLDMSNPYTTPWGIYDSSKNEFIQEQYKEEFNTQVKGEFAEAELTERAEADGLLIEKLDEAVWNALSKEQKQAVLIGGKYMSSKDIMEDLKKVYKVRTKTFSTPLDTLLEHYKNSPFRLANNENTETWNKTQEIEWLKTALPQFDSSERLHIVEGVIKIANSKNSEYAWGQFKQGVIYIYKGAAKGTLYHEAFHAVTHTLLTNAELDSLYAAAKVKYGNKSKVALEEELAEDFRRYVQFEQDTEVSAITRFFRKLKHFVQGLFGKDRYIDNMFYRISRGKYSKRALHQSDVMRNREITSREIDALEKKLDRLHESEEALTRKYAVKNLDAVKAKLQHPLRDYKLSFRTINGERVRFLGRGEKDLIDLGNQSAAETYIAENKLQGIAFASSWLGKGYVEVYTEAQFNADRKTVNDIMKDLRITQQQLETLNNQYAMQEASNELLEEQEVFYRTDIVNHYNEQMKYENLDQEDKDLIQAKGFSMVDFNDMSIEEKENLFYCR